MSASICWDAHGCFPLQSNADMSELDRYQNSGVDFLSINIGMDYNPLEEIVQVAARFRSVIENDERYVLAHSLSCIDQAKRDGKMAIAFDLEGSVMLKDNLHMVSFFYDLGVRQMLLAYNKDNSIAGGCLDPDLGLTPLGHQVVKEMNRVGMVVDVSHMSFKASVETLDASEKPVIFSHSNAKALQNHPRNITDEQIKLCAKQGGVIGVNGIGKFLNPDSDISTPKIIEHIDHMVQLVGPDHVGIGLDYVVDKQELLDFFKQNPDVYKSDKGVEKSLLRFVEPEQIPEIQTQLKDRGYPEDSIQKIMGENFYRIAKQCWK